MDKNKIIGIIFLSTPFILAGYHMYNLDGWRMVLFVYGLSFVVVGSVAAGVYFLMK